ncbi:enoyl-CoA hydratase [Streptomyces virginiae]|uniref:Enoyl-CoA hydratase n=1 Tax=Streptomyces virginiae TaxID=1961 RepID=A0ABQ3NVP3_STRVG|nr:MULTISPECIES: enoyl-CoA hydratase family protein [Streptomyces]GLV90221.1 enoyl-CoA hydratase [Streptomyces lavendulae subsp. lavendulae]KOU11084.1 enoyl-CoA hydratase [Streptomyces sp. WM6349]KOV38645.1 enoyl-CoA hydratase [Streptomyces sp. H036]MBP2344797.1 enoyl-CoA hydratase [Streptomyces virginiae]GGP89208.1 enoyl-CoA hydratase [Streptomyces virginiae]
MATPVHATTAAGVTTLTLDSPANRNALSAELVAELRAAFAAAGADPAVRAVVLTHTGGTFCSGADLKSPFDPADFVALLREIAELPKPVVARVTGHVRAGGLGLLGVCDITAAGPQSSYAFTETHLGVVPAVISAPLLPRLDPRAAARYFLTAEAFDAAEAARIGLLTLHGDDVDEILAPVLAGLRKAGPQALAATRRLVTAPVRAALAQDGIALTELSARHFASAEAREGITARFERRDPSWAL